MVERKQYPDIRQPRWANRFFVIGLTGSVLWAVLWAGYMLETSDRLGYALLFLAPAIYIVLPMCILLSLITLQSWNRWQNTQKRTITLLCSVGVPLSFIAIVVFGI